MMEHQVDQGNWPKDQTWSIILVMDHKIGADGPQPMFRGRPLGDLLRRHRRTLVAAGLDRIRRAVPLYAALPAEQMGSDIAAAVERGVHLVVTALADGRPSPATLDELRDSAALRAEEGIPIDMILRAYLAGTAGVISEVATYADPDDIGELVAGVALALDVVGEAMGAAAERYVEEQLAIVGQALSARRALLSDLLAGRRPDDTAAALPACFAVVHLAIGRHQDEDVDDLVSTVAGRRKVRRVVAALAGDGRDVPLEALAAEGGLVLVPGDDADELWADLALRLDEAAAAAGVPITAAGAVVAPDGVAGAARLADDLLGLALALGRPPGLHALDDLVIEYQLTRPGPGRVALARRLAPLAGHPDLVATVREHLATGLDRRRTAQRLHLHPNSVDYRLKRAALLTGLDTTSRAAAWEVGTALVAWDAEGQPAP